MGKFDSVLFIDASPDMVEQVRQKTESLNVQNADTLCCDFMAENPPDLKADYIIMAQVLLHIKDTELILSRLYAALNEGGHLLIVDFDKNGAVESDKVHNGFDKQELADVLKRIGFVKVDAETFYHGEKIFMNQDASLFVMDAVK